MKRFIWIGILSGLLSLSVACGGDKQSKKNGVALRTVKQCSLSAQAPDALTQAERWASTFKSSSKGAGAQVEQLTSGWTQAHFVRAWKVDDSRWRAIVASSAQPEPSDSVVVLEMLGEKGFTVSSVAVTKGSALWPSLDQ